MFCLQQEVTETHHNRGSVPKHRQTAWKPPHQTSQPKAPLLLVAVAGRSVLPRNEDGEVVATHRGLAPSGDADVIASNGKRCRGKAHHKGEANHHDRTERRIGAVSKVWQKVVNALCQDCKKRG